MANTKMLWGGRFSATPKGAVRAFLSSENICLDARLVPYDIEGSIAHVAMLCKQGILKKQEAAPILKALSQLSSKSQKNEFLLDAELEDVHMNVEAETTKLTQEAKKMHTARSRNDQVSVDTRLYLRDEINKTSKSLILLIKEIAFLSKRKTIFPSYTHMQVAQPITLSFYCRAYADAFTRDFSRLSECYSRINLNPLGAGAVAGTTWNIDREHTAKLLGFSGVQQSPLDVVTSRGEMEAELIFALTMLLTHTGRIAEDICFLSAKRLAILSDATSTGSSMMPQKKNPDPMELLRGKTARMHGLLMHSLSLMKGLPSGYNMDTQESNYAVMHALDTAQECIPVLCEVLATIDFDPEAIKEELEKGYACATELADLLARKGVPFRSAHEITGKLVKGCVAKRKYLSTLTANEVSAVSKVKISDSELKNVLNVDKTARMHSPISPEFISPLQKAVSEREEKISAAKKLLEKEVKQITG